MFFAFISIMFVFSAYWVTKRREELKSPNHLESLTSREAAFLLNNFIILSILVVTFLGTNFPILSELFTGQKVTVGPPFYEKVNGPLFAVLLLLMGIAPLTMWYRTSINKLGRIVLGPAVASLVVIVTLFIMGVTNWIALLGIWIVTFSLTLTLLEFWRGVRARIRRHGEMPLAALSHLIARSRRRYGGYIIHIGVLVMAFGIIATELYQQETQIRLLRGESVTVGDYTMTFNGIERYPGDDDLIITAADVDVSRDGEFIRSLSPRTEFYTRSEQPMTIPGVRSTIGEDFYVILINWEGTSNDAATFRIFVNPLINWVWAGAVIFMVGTIVAAWSDSSKRKVKAAKPAPRVAVRGAVGD